METSMIHNNFIVIFHTVHMKTFPELGWAQEFNPANDRDILDLNIFIRHCKPTNQTNLKAQPEAKFAVPHTLYGAIYYFEEFAAWMVAIASKLKYSLK